MYTKFIIAQGDTGIAVNKHQGYLNLLQQHGMVATKVVEDGVYGPTTTKAVKELQKTAGLAQDGMIGNDTWDAIVNRIRDLGVTTNIPVASRTFFLTQGATGLDVFKLQEYLNEVAEKNPCLRPVPVDGAFGVRTTNAVKQFQYLYDLDIDGRIGKATWDAIINERNKNN